MAKVLIIGSGISGMTCAVRCAQHGLHVLLVSPDFSERSQSVMAAGGINAVTQNHEEGDSVSCHIEDTLKGGSWLGGKKAVQNMCSHAEKIILYLEEIGTVFSVDERERLLVRAFGGQSYKRTHYCGSSTGKQIVSALIMEVRRYEAAGLIERRIRHFFHSALIKEGTCYGALLFDECSQKLVSEFADAVVMAVGGQNALFGKTTGTTQNDGYAVGKLFQQGAVLKNLEFIQFHPTTLETAQKRMLISEAVRGEGGRLFYLDNGKRVYFMEEKYGPNGNLMTRDVVSREIESVEKEVFLDISFLDKKQIDERLPEVRDLCRKYGRIDISKEPIPVAPSVHFFMGGLAVHLNHETSIRNLYAVGECASMYHGANRLGGNSLLAALYSGNAAAVDISGKRTSGGRDGKPNCSGKRTSGGRDDIPDFSEDIMREQERFAGLLSSNSPFSVMHIRDMLAKTMRSYMGISRTEDLLKQGMDDVDDYLSVAARTHYDSSASIYTNYALSGILTLARGALTCALERRESRGAHYRSDYPESADEYAFASLISYENGAWRVWLDREGTFES